MCTQPQPQPQLVELEAVAVAVVVVVACHLRRHKRPLAPDLAIRSFCSRKRQARRLAAASALLHLHQALAAIRCLPTSKCGRNMRRASFVAAELRVRVPELLVQRKGSRWPLPVRLQAPALALAWVLSPPLCKQQARARLLTLTMHPPVVMRQQQHQPLLRPLPCDGQAMPVVVAAVAQLQGAPPPCDRVRSERQGRLPQRRLLPCQTPRRQILFSWRVLPAQQPIRCRL